MYSSGEHLFQHYQLAIALALLFMFSVHTRTSCAKVPRDYILLPRVTWGQRAQRIMCTGRHWHVVWYLGMLRACYGNFLSNMDLINYTLRNTTQVETERKKDVCTTFHATTFDLARRVRFWGHNYVKVEQHSAICHCPLSPQRSALSLQWNFYFYTLIGKESCCVSHLFIHLSFSKSALTDGRACSLSHFPCCCNPIPDLSLTDVYLSDKHCTVNDRHPVNRFYYNSNFLGGFSWGLFS